MKQALVIGGTGFLGLNLIDALVEAEVPTRVTWRRRSITVYAAKRPVELVPGDLTDVASLERAMEGCDTVFLTGGHYPRYSLDRDAAIARGVSDVANTCAAARNAGVSRVVYTSSIASLAKVPGRSIDATDVPAKMPSDSVYRAVKWAMEREAERWLDKGLDVVTLLPGGCLGPWDARVGTGGLLVGFITKRLSWWVDGVVNLVDVRDVARAHVRAARRAETGARYCLSGTPTPLREVFALVASRYGGSFPPELSAADARLRSTAAEHTAELTRARVAFPRELVDIITWGQDVRSSRALEALDFVARPLGESLADAHDWFRRFGYLPPQTHSSPSTSSTVPRTRNTP